MGELGEDSTQCLEITFRLGREGWVSQVETLEKDSEVHRTMKLN